MEFQGGGVTSLLCENRDVVGGCATVLAASEAYPLWAPHYSSETAVSSMEDELVAAITPPLKGLRLLDVGCGTGRRLRDVEAGHAIGVDLCPEMIAAGADQLQWRPRVKTVVGDVRSLPFPDCSFDVVWCRLMIGHVADCGAVYRELARVTTPDGRVIVSDFHEDAYAAGHRRSFRAGESVIEVEHHVHSLARQLREAADAGLESVAIKEGCIGASVEEFYRSANLADRFREHLGLPVVLALAFRRSA